MKRSSTACGSSSSTSVPALKSIQLALNSASCVLVEIFIVGHERPERRAASRGEEHQLAARESQRRSGHQVVARSLQEVQSRLRDGLCVGQHVDDGLRSALLHAAERFLFKGRDAALLVARRGIFINRLVEPAEIALEIVDQRDRSVENPAVCGAGPSGSSRRRTSREPPSAPSCRPARSASRKTALPADWP